MKERDENQSHSAATLALVLILVPAMYVLSVGPVVAIVRKLNMGETAMQYVYAPVFWLHDHTVLKEPLEAYSHLWGS